jgi:hypothetical protein
VRQLTRWLVAALGAAIALACANRGGIGPPGGPIDANPPRVTLVSPESGSVNQRVGAARFEFNKVLSDNPSGGQLDRFFLISPTDGVPRINWHRDRIDVRPRHSWRANTAYTVTLLPGLSDVRGNQMHAGAVTVFSTGATIPSFGILGTIFDWAAERPAGGALVEAISRPASRRDSVVYITAADSLGQYVVGPFGPGRYTLVGWLDKNNNRILDNGEMYDSTTVVIEQRRPVVELLAISRDTFPPRMTAIARADSATLRVTFDRALDPKMPLTPALFRLQKADSTNVDIRSVIGAKAAADSAARRDSTRRDSAARRDTTTRRDTTARRDTTVRRDTTAAAPGTPTSIVPLPSPTPARPPAPAQAPRLVPRVSTAAPPPPKPSLPGPETAVLLNIAPPALLEPGVQYRVTARNVRNIVGRAGTSTRTVTMPKVPLPTAADSLKRDSTRRRDSTRTPPRKPPSR